jgi:putative tricarboxylic transport membrane protein
MTVSVDRRSLLLGSLAATFGAGAFGRAAFAQGAPMYDSLRVFVPAAPGGGWDQTGRAIEATLRALGMVKSFQFEHVGGAGGTVGLPRFVNSYKGQGNAIMIGGMVMVGAIITNKTPVNLSATTPLARLTEEPLAVVVPAASPHKSMADLVKALKERPGGVSWAGGSAGGSDHILVGLIARAAGVDPKQANYVAFAGGGPAQAAIIGNQVTAGVSGYGEFAEQVKAGKMRALAISSAKRQAGVDVPTLKEQGVDVELSNWRGVFGAPEIDAAAKAKLVDLMTKMNASKEWKEVVEKRGWSESFLAGDAYAAFIKTDTDRIHGILKGLGLAA